MPRQGLWVVDVLTSDPGVSGKVTVALDGGLTFVGTTARAGDWLETGYLRVLPGAAGMGRTARRKFYSNGSVGVVVKDLLAAAGEALAASATPRLLSVQLQSYALAEDAVGRSLSALLQDRRLVDPVWRALPDGTVWVGYETWPDAGVKAPVDYQDINELPHEGRAELGFDAPTLVPGQSLEGRHLSAVQHDVDGESVRTSVWFED
jgi:type IV secretory pathway protease TraF